MNCDTLHGRAKIHRTQEGADYLFRERLEFVHWIETLRHINALGGAIPRRPISRNTDAADCLVDLRRKAL